MKLIADCGSTKTDWALLRTGASPYFFKTKGYNPNYIGTEEIALDLRASLPKDTDPGEVSAVEFYGAGINEKTAGIVRSALAQVFSQARNIVTESDLLGAAKALLGNSAGFAAILGTGANTCIYDGKKIQMNIASLGFLLGDEGSGAYIGKMLLRDYLRGNMPAEILSELRDKLQMTNTELVTKIYSEPKPNSFCAGFCDYIAENTEKHPYCNELVRIAFRDFFRNMVSLYPHYQDYPLNCVGSVACGFREILGQIASEFGMSTGKILRSPIFGLATCI